MPLPTGLPRTTIKGDVYRIVKEGVDPLSTQGSTRLGGRYNPPGETGVLYASFRKQTAAAEVVRHSTTSLVRRWWQYTLHVEAIALDLTEPAVLAILSASSNALLEDDRALPRRLARDAKEAGFQALVVPSAAQPAQKNLVLFLDTLSDSPVLTASEPLDLQA